MQQTPDYMNRRPAITVVGSRRDAFSVCAMAAVSLACSAGLCVAAVLLHPPVAVVPLLVLVCVGCPVLGTWELAPALASLRHGRRPSKRAAIAELRRGLAALPEVEHPLGH